MVATIIAYGMSLSMFVLMAGCVGAVFHDDYRHQVEPFPILLAFVVFGSLAWGFAKLGGI